MSKPIRILLQTTLLPSDNDWSVDRFSMLRDYLISLKDDANNVACDVVVRDHQVNSNGDDLVLSTLNDSDFDELWLFALDTGDGLSINDCAGITAFHRSGRGILTTRDHQDMGICMCCLDEIGALHFFQSKHLNPDESQRCIDDTGTPTISWPNYHSGRNGDYQYITPVEPIHPLLHNPDSPSGIIKLFPSHPHEGAVGVPTGSKARVIATGISQTTGRSFNLVVALEQAEETNGDRPGRVIAQSTFHHFADYNWNVSNGCPSFVTEPAGDGMQTEPSALADIHAYVRNLVGWLAPVPNRHDNLSSRIIRKTLEGKVAVVTGASKGIGASLVEPLETRIATHLAAEGAAVVDNSASSKEGADRVVDEIVNDGGKAIAQEQNVTRWAASSPI